MCIRNNGPWGTARQRMKWAWGLLALLGLWFAPMARAADDWLPTGTFFTASQTGSAVRADAISSLAMDPAEPGTLYAGGTYPGGPSVFFKSTDGGTSWTSQAQFYPVGTLITALALDPLARNTIYAGLKGVGVVKNTAVGGAGSSWVHMSGLASQDVLALAVDPATGTIYAGTGDRGLFKSADGGTNWSSINNGLRTRVSSLAIDPANPGTVYAGTLGAGVFKTIDGGATWTEARSGMVNAEVYSLAIDPATPSRLYAGTNAGVFKSTNGGASWTAVNSGLNPTLVNAVAIDPAAPGTVYAGTEGGGVFKSRDGGISWLAINNGLPAGSIVNAFALNPVTPGMVYVATHGGVFKSTNSGPVSTPLPDSGQSVILPLSNGGSITASAQEPGTQVQLVESPTGASVAVVTSGSALLQHSVAGQPLVGLPRGGGLAVLTPSCTAARVVVTATGNTHTAYTDGCAVAVSGAGDAVPTPAQGLTAPQGRIRAEDVQLYLPGPDTQRSALVSVRLDGAAQQTLVSQRTLARAGGFNVYVIALVPGNLVARVAPLFLQKQATGGWGELTMPVAALMSNIAPQTADARILIEVLKDTDMRILAGTEIYVGYGTSDEEMLQAGRYRALVRIQ